MPRTLSLTSRLVLLFAALTAALLILTGVVLGVVLDRHFRELDQHELEGKFALIKNLLQRRTPAIELSPLFDRLDDSFIGHEGMGVMIRGQNDEILHVIHREHFNADLLAGVPVAPGITEWEANGRPHLGLESIVRLTPYPGATESLQVLVALDLSYHHQFLSSVRYGLWLGIAAAALVSALFGWFAAHRGLAPLRRITATASHLSAERLDERLDGEEAPAEIHELVDAFNGMLVRLQAAFKRLSDFSADIAHELRTPISNLMTQTAVALSHPRTSDEYKEVLASNLEEYDRIARMVSDMLFLAKAEDRDFPRSTEIVDLAAEADALINFYEVLAQEQQVRLVRQGQAQVRGDRLMLRRALSNLLSNALRHASAGGEIEITMESREPCVRLSVRNAGDTIPPDQIERIFERFHRGSARRESQGEGAGLGLAITRSIVQAHGGRIEAQSARGLTEFLITLPRIAEATVRTTV